MARTVDIGERIAELREERALTQVELAEKARISPSTLSLIESGKVERPHVSTIRKISRVLGVEPQELRRAKEPEAPKAPAAPRTLDELRDFLEARLGSAWIALPEDEWGNWWRNVSKEEADRRHRQIVAESKLIRETWGRAKSREELADVARSAVSLLRFVRRRDALFFAPHKDESEEEFQERSNKGRAIPSYYYDSNRKEQRQDMELEAEEEQRQLTSLG